MRTQLTENTEAVEGIPMLVSPQRIAYQEEIGVPILTADAYEAMKAAWQAEQAPAPVSQPSLKYLVETAWGEGGIMNQPAAPQVSGQYWANPVTGANLGAYIAGQTPQEVLELREQDIFAAIRGL